MTYDCLAPQFYIRAAWPSRREDPCGIAYRLRHFLDTLAGIDATLHPWSVGSKRKASYAAVRDDLTSLVRADVARSDAGEVELVDGYGISGLSQDKRELYSFVGSAGGVCPWPMWNRIYFHTTSGRVPDPAIVTYRLMKAVTLATIACWEPLFCRTATSDLLPGHDEWYSKSWITYVPPANAADVDLVGIPFSERTPDGGLLLSATEKIFDAGNAAHLDGAQRIYLATRHLDATLPAL